MPYATEEDALAMYGVDFVTLSCDRNGDGVLDSAAFDLALDWATSRIDSILTGRAAVDELDIPDSINAACVDLAIYRVSMTHDVLTDHKIKLHDQAMDWLKMVAVGEQGNGQESPTVQGNVSFHVARTNGRELTRDKLSGLL